MVVASQSFEDSALNEFDALEVPVAPPITMTCRQVRYETLLLFYRSCRLLINVPTPRRQYSSSQEAVGLRLSPSKPTVRLPKQTNTFILRAPEKFLVNIRKLCIQSLVFSPSYWTKTQWDVEFTAGGGEISLQAGQPMCQRGEVPEGYGRARRQMEARMKKRLEIVAAREDVQKFRRDDIALLQTLITPIEEK